MMNNSFRLEGRGSEMERTGHVKYQPSLHLLLLTFSMFLLLRLVPQFSFSAEMMEEQNENDCSCADVLAKSFSIFHQQASKKMKQKDGRTKKKKFWCCAIKFNQQNHVRLLMMFEHNKMRFSIIAWLHSINSFLCFKQSWIVHLCNNDINDKQEEEKLRGRRKCKEHHKETCLMLPWHDCTMIDVSLRLLVFWLSIKAFIFMVKARQEGKKESPLKGAGDKSIPKLSFIIKRQHVAISINSSIHETTKSSSITFPSKAFER